MGLRSFKFYEGTKNLYSQEGKWGIGVKKNKKRYTWSVFYDNKKVATGSGFCHAIEACDAALARAKALREEKTNEKTTNKRNTVNSNGKLSVDAQA